MATVPLFLMLSRNWPTKGQKYWIFQSLVISDFILGVSFVLIFLLKLNNACFR